MRHHHRLIDLSFLHIAVEANIDRTLGLGHSDAVSFQERFRDAIHRGRLVVELDILAHRQTLDIRRVHPIGGPALRGILRPAAAKIEDRRAVAPGVEDRHAGVLQADDVVQARRHNLAGGPRVTVGDRHGDLFMRAHDHLRPLARLEVDHRVMKAAVTRAGIERDVFNPQLAQHFDHQVRTVLRVTLAPDPRRPNLSAAFRCVCHVSSVIVIKFFRMM